jgi:[ribosomal protein S5]-alanine N-acetyltransferase
MSLAPIETQRLRLISLAPKHTLALIEGYEAYKQCLGWAAADGLRDFYASGAVSPEWLAKLDPTAAADPWVHGFGLLHMASNTVIGGIGFKGAPNEDGMVEIGYGVVPKHQGQGLATEAAKALITYAFGHERVRVVRAHTMPTPNASTRLLAKCGFTFIGEVIEPEDGLVWRWERKREG